MRPCFRPDFDLKLFFPSRLAFGRTSTHLLIRQLNALPSRLIELLVQPFHPSTEIVAKLRLLVEAALREDHAPQFWIVHSSEEPLELRLAHVIEFLEFLQALYVETRIRERY